MNILVVDDDRVSREILRTMVEGNREHWVTPASSGAEAWDLLRGGAWRFDAAFIDLEMPEIDGFELVNRIRTQLRSRPPVIVLCTARADRPTVIRAASLGIGHYIVKPAKMDAVRAKLAAVAKMLQPAPNGAAGVQEQTLSGPRSAATASPARAHQAPGASDASGALGANAASSPAQTTPAQPSPTQAGSARAAR